MTITDGVLSKEDLEGLEKTLVYLEQDETVQQMRKVANTPAEELKPEDVEDLVDMVCPDCGTKLNVTKDHIYCPACVSRQLKLGSCKTREQMMLVIGYDVARLVQLEEPIKTYNASIIWGTLIPKHLHGISVREEMAKIRLKTSSLSCMERKLLTGTCHLISTIGKHNAKFAKQETPSEEAVDNG